MIKKTWVHLKAQRKKYLWTTFILFELRGWILTGAYLYYMRDSELFWPTLVTVIVFSAMYYFVIYLFVKKKIKINIFKKKVDTL